MKKLILIRHGETDWNKEHRIQGWSDIPLNGKGKEQSHKVAMFLYNYYPEIDIIISSDLKRASRTAQPLSDKLGLDIIKKPELREQNFGNMEGDKYFSYKEEQIKRLVKILYNENFKSDEEGIESLSTFNQRITTEIKSIANNNEYTNKTIAIFTHGGVIKIIISYILNIDHINKRFFNIDNTSITTIVRSDKDKTLRVETINYFQYNGG